MNEICEVTLHIPGPDLSWGGGVGKKGVFLSELGQQTGEMWAGTNPFPDLNNLCQRRQIYNFL